MASSLQFCNIDFANYLGFTPCALLHQAPRHGASDGECLEERADEVTQAKGYQLLLLKKKKARFRI